MAVSCPLLDQYCKRAELIFTSGPLLTVCSLYPNQTLSILEATTLTKNTVVDDAWQDPIRAFALELSSMVATGLLSYCALISGCSKASACSIASLSDFNGHFPIQAVARCWYQICESYVASINPDFGGLDVRLSIWKSNSSIDEKTDDPIISCANLNSHGQSCCEWYIPIHQALPIKPASAANSTKQP